MTRELAYIQKIKSLSPIPGADKIELAEVLGWQVICRIGDFKIGDFVVYCEVDSVLAEYPCFEFLRPRKFRIKTLKLKNTISQGICFPISVLKEVDPSFDLSSIKIGQDVTEALKITKHDPEAALDVEIEPVKRSWLSKKYSFWKWRLFGFKPAKSGNFPSDVPKTDEVRVQKVGHELEEHAGEMCYITEKCEGTSSTFVYRKSGNWLAKLFGQGYTFQVCSRNRIIYNSQKGAGETNHHIFRAGEKYNILDGLKKLNRNIAVQGEVIGPKIQANVYKIPEVDLRVFSIFDLDKKKYVHYDELVQLIKQLNLVMVPVLNDNHTLVNDIKYYVELSKGFSKINDRILREGIIVRSKSKSASFKSINPEYLLKQELDE